MPDYFATAVDHVLAGVRDGTRDAPRNEELEELEAMMARELVAVLWLMLQHEAASNAREGLEPSMEFQQAMAVYEKWNELHA